MFRLEVDDFQSVTDDAAGHELLSSVAALLHQAARKTLKDRTRGLTETLHLIASSSVREVRGMGALARNVIL